MVVAVAAWLSNSRTVRIEMHAGAVQHTGHQPAHFGHMPQHTGTPERGEGTRLREGLLESLQRIQKKFAFRGFFCW
jgi:hypothetical protein